MSIADNLRHVHERIARAATASGRSADDVTLVGVTKYVGASEAAELLAAGCTDLGESRPQELWAKAAAIAPAGLASASGAPAVRWHMIGHLQRNKVRRTLPLVTLIHSVDSERLLAAIDEAQAAVFTSAPARVLLEVNTSGEAAKHGLVPDDVELLLAAATRFPHVAICGLMTMAALEGGPAVAERDFATLRELRDRLRAIAPERVRLDELSMGMSADFEAAIRQGATIVRVGSILWE
jgi:hypothetical protein